MTRKPKFNFKESVVTRKLILLPLLAAGACMAQAQQPSKVGVLNIQAAIAATKDGQKAANDLNTKYGPKKKDVEGKQATLAGLKDQLQKGQNTMSEAGKAELVRSIDEKTKSLNREMEDAEAELQQDQQKVLQTIGQRMMVVIDKYSKDHGYTLILDVSSQQTPVLFASNNIDVTKDIIDLYDKNTGTATGAGTTAPAPAAPKPAASTPAAPKK